MLLVVGTNTNEQQPKEDIMTDYWSYFDVDMLRDEMMRYADELMHLADTLSNDGVELDPVQKAMVRTVYAQTMLEKVFEKLKIGFIAGSKVSVRQSLEHIDSLIKVLE